MKKTIFVLFSVCMIAISCGKDDPDPVAPADQPYANSNVGTNWVYETKTQDPTTMDTVTNLDTSRVISGDTAIGSKSYYRVEHNDGRHSYYNHTGNDYYQFQNFTLPSIIDTAIEVLYLKDNQSSGSWDQILNVTVDIGIPITIPITFTSNIAGTALTQTVSGITYTDVIKVTTTLSIPATTGITLTQNTIVNYYARNIGLIQGNYDIELSAGLGGIHNQTLLKFSEPH